MKLCDVFDANYMELVPHGSTGSGVLDPYMYSFVATGGSSMSNGTPVDVTLEYASTYVDDSFLLSNGSVNNNPSASEMRAECDIENGGGTTVWYSTPAAAIADPAGLGVVTKFRVKANT